MVYKKIKKEIDALKDKTKVSTKELKQHVKEHFPKTLEDSFDMSKDLLEEGVRFTFEMLKPRTLKDKLFQSVNSNSGKLSGAIGAFMAETGILEKLESLTEGASTIYDKAMDSEYLSGISGGGGNHRLFDNGHDILNAWDKVKNALPDDSFSDEVIGYTSALWKDLTTVKGLPFSTLTRDTYDSLAENICGVIPGLNREYLYDLLSFDAMEIFSTSLGAISIIFAFKKDDQEKLAEILGSMGIISILSANPIMGIFVISTSAYAYQRKKMKLDKSAFSKSAIVSGASTAMFGLLGMPLLAELVIIAVLTKLLRSQVLDNNQLHEFLKIKISSWQDDIKDISFENILNQLKANREVA